MKKYLYQGERKAKFCRVLLSIFLISFPLYSYSKLLPTTVLETSSGLLSNSIQDVLKSKKNDKVWIATNSGLSVYNGVGIKNYTMKNGLPHNNCKSIVEDNYGVIWVATFGGGIAYLEQGKFRQVHIQSKDNNEGFIKKLFLFGDTIFASSSNGIYSLNVVTKTQNVSFDVSNEVDVLDFFSHNRSMYFFSRNATLYKLDKQGVKKLNQIDNTFLNSFLLQKDTLYLSITSSFEDIGKTVKMSFYDFLVGGSDFLFSKSLPLNNMIKTANGLLASSYFVDSRNESLFFLNRRNLNISALQVNTNFDKIQCLNYDERTQVLFIGTNNKGLKIVDLTNNIQLLDKRHLIYYGFSSNDQTIACTKEYIVLDSFRIEKTDFIEFVYNLGKSRVGDRKVNEIQNIKSYFLSRTFEIENCRLEKNKIYVKTTIGLFTLGIKLNELNIENFKFSPQGSLLFNTNENTKLLSSLKRNLGYSLNIKDTLFTKKGKPIKGVFNATELNGEILLFSHFSGVHKQIKDNLFSLQLEMDSLLTSGGIHIVKKTTPTSALISDYQGNIFRLINLSSQLSCEKILKAETLMGNAVKDITESQRLIFVATNLGVNIIDLSSGKRHFIDEEFGIAAKYIQKIEIRDSDLLIFSTKGLFSLSIDFITKHHDCGDINISKILLGGRELVIDGSDLLELSEIKNNLKFILSSQGVKYPKKLQYRYKVSGDYEYSSDWKQLSANTSFTIPFLPIGLSQVILETNNLFTGNQHQYKILNVSNTLAFYESKLFYILITLFVSYLGYYFIKRRFKKLYRRQKEKSLIEKKLQEAKMEALTSQMSPHFIFNSLNAIQHFVLQNEIDKSVAYINNFSTLIRSTLDYSSKMFITLEEELNYLDLYVKIQNLRFGNKIEFKKNINISTESYELLIPPLLLQPLIENCFEHAFDQNSVAPIIEITITTDSNTMELIIVDNGFGLKETTEDNSKGLKLVKGRIKMLNQRNEMSIESLSIGTRLKLTLFG